MVGVITFIVSTTALLSWAWVRGIDNMQKNHTDYKGHDLFDEPDDSITKTAGRDGWDDDKINTEQDFI